MMRTREECIHEIQKRLEGHLSAVYCVVIDNSDEHIGHASAKGAGHYAVYVVSSKFEGCSLIMRHRMVYAAVGDCMGADIHALEIRAHTLSEWENYRASTS